MNYFSIHEFLIDPAMRSGIKPVPLHVVDKLWSVHLPILNPLRAKMREPVSISQNSGFRPYAWEKNKGRSGDSQHTFGDHKPDAESWLGAVDLTADSFERLIMHLNNSAYKRVCIYQQEQFVHCDMKGDRRLLFENGDSGWQYIKER